MSKSCFPPRAGARLGFFLALLALVAAPAALAQEALRIAEEVEEVIETPHPYPAGGSTLTPVWSHTFHHPGASYIAVRFERFELAEGDVLVLTDPQGVYRHTYTGKGYKDLGKDFWGLSVLGDTMEVTLLSQARSHEAYGVRIDRWAHGYPEDEVPGIDALCGAEDFQDIECYADTEPGPYEKSRAVVRLIKNGSAHCTGWLASCENHIITNEHCVGSQSELNSIEFQFEYKRPECGAGTPGVELQLQGGTLLEVDPALDYALIMPDLAGSDPQQTYGYIQLETRLPDIDEAMYILHHPSGDPKRLSIESTHPEDQSGRCEVFSTDQPACTGAPNGDIGYYCDTEGGSSGSPVLSQLTNRAIALHHCANCPNRGVAARDVFLDLESSGNPLPSCSVCDPGPPPTGLVATPNGDNSIRLTWSAAPNTAKYRIYRSRTGCAGTFTRIAETLGTTYTDDVSGGVVFSYAVSAVSPEDCETERSNCDETSTSGPCLDAPLFDGIVSVTNRKTSGCSLELAWNEGTPQCAGTLRYNVYRSVVPGFEPTAAQRIATCVEGTSFVDTGVASGFEYYYVVRAEDDAGTGTGPCSGGVEEANTVESGNFASGPDDVYFADGFESGGGWTLEGEWEIDTPTGLGGTPNGGSGSTDPNGAFAGGFVLGVDLSGQNAELGNYEDDVTPAALATGPVIDASGRSGAILRFQRWLGSERSRYDESFIEVFDGTSWVRVWTNPDSSFSDGAWVPFEVDVSEQLAGRSDARIRFGYETDVSVKYCGWNIDELELYELSTCSDGTSGQSPVPDGRFVGGSPMDADKAGGENVALTWDVTACPSPFYHLLYGESADVATYGLSGAVCNLSTSGSDTVPVPTPPAGTFRWWILTATDGSVEGHHGFSSDGVLRPSEAGGLCGVVSQDVTGTCP